MIDPFRQAMLDAEKRAAEVHAVSARAAATRFQLDQLVTSSVADARRWHAVVQEGWLVAQRHLEDKHATEMAQTQMMTAPSPGKFLQGYAGDFNDFRRVAAALDAAAHEPGVFATPPPRPFFVADTKRWDDE